MTLKLSVKAEVAKNLERYEGQVEHLYLDVVGRVTVGVGHLVINRAAISSVTMYKKGSAGRAVPASLAEKQAEYDTVKKLPYGQNFGASSYQKHTRLFMTNADMDAQRDKHINTFHRELSGFYRPANGFSVVFDGFPDEVQKALFDMVFNLGITKLRSQYLNFNKAIKAESWKVAARHSRRLGIGPARNRYVYDLFMAAHKNALPTP